MGGAWLYRDYISIMGKIMYILSIILIDNFPHHIPLHRSLWCILITATQPYTANWQSKVKHTCSSQKTLTNGDYHSSTLGNIRHVYVRTYIRRYITLHCMTLHCIARYCMAYMTWHDIPWHDMAYIHGLSIYNMRPGISVCPDCYIYPLWKQGQFSPHKPQNLSIARILGFPNEITPPSTIWLFNIAMENHHL